MRSLTIRSILAASPLAFAVACSVLGQNGGTGNNDSNVSTGTPNPNGVVDGQQCATGDDCKSGVCQDGACVPPPDPTTGTPQCGVSLGGAPCANGQACKDSGDCTSGACVNAVCADPAANDGIKDGAETDVDCGGGAPTN